jgi:hypothetical protein
MRAKFRHEKCSNCSMEHLLYMHIHWALMPEVKLASGILSVRKGDLFSNLESLVACEISLLCARHNIDLLLCSVKGGRLHILTRMTTALAVSRWVLLAKMNTSRMLQRELGMKLSWPSGYSLRSLSPSHVEKAKAFIVTAHFTDDKSGQLVAAL